MRSRHPQCLDHQKRAVTAGWGRDEVEEKGCEDGAKAWWVREDERCWRAGARRAGDWLGQLAGGAERWPAVLCCCCLSHSNLVERRGRRQVGALGAEEGRNRMERGRGRVCGDWAARSGSIEVECTRLSRSRGARGSGCEDARAAFHPDPSTSTTTTKKGLARWLVGWDVVVPGSTSWHARVRLGGGGRADRGCQVQRNWR